MLRAKSRTDKVDAIKAVSGPSVLKMAEFGLMTCYKSIGGRMT